MDLYFEDVAAKWDTPQRIWRAEKIGQKIRECLPHKHYGTASEFGCGTGLVGFQLLDVTDHLLFVDESWAMLEIVQEKLTCLQVKHAGIHQGNLMGPRTASIKSDLIFNSMVLHHVEDVQHAISQFAWYLNPGGCLCIVDLNPDDGHFHDDHPSFHGYCGFEQKTLQDVLRDSGFLDVKSETFLHDVKMIGMEPHPFSLFIMTGIKGDAAPEKQI